MKTVTVHEWNGMRVDLWRMDAGDKIERHSHPFQHTTGVARGRSMVTVWYSTLGWIETYEMKPGDKDFAFPPNVEHEIEVLEDGTIIVNMTYPGLPGQKGNDGGIATDD